MSKYTTCPDCEHHISNHTNVADGRGLICRYAAAMDETGWCRCTKTKKEIDAYVAKFDTRVCTICGLGEVEQNSGGGDWAHSSKTNCIRVMGKKIREMEKELFSRRSAIRDQKERTNV